LRRDNSPTDHNLVTRSSLLLTHKTDSENAN
jgi:hypothetical protein